MNSPIDFNKMVSSIYDTVMKLQQSAEQMIGLDTLWCRALPHKGGEDVVIQEYTLSNVDCPQAIKVVTENSQYQAGTYNVDLWGVSYEAPLEVNVNKTSWDAIYGPDTAPQKGDIVYIKMLNRLYEVASSTIVYTLTTLPSSYKCSLQKYQRKASRHEPDEIRISIDELTQSQDILFGDTISNEVADAVIERETSYNQSTFVDPIRSCDLSSIVTEDVLGAYDNLISSAYYNFISASQNVVWRGLNASYGRLNDDVNTHWIYTCWVRLNPNADNADIDEASKTTLVESQVQLKGLYLKDKHYYVFSIAGTKDFEAGDDVVLYRGNLISLAGTLDTVDCGEGLVLKIPSADVLAASKQANKFWETIKTGWKLKKSVITDTASGNTSKKKSITYNLLSGYNETEKIIDISYNGTQLALKFGNGTKKISIKELSDNDWHYMMLDFNIDKVQCVINKVTTNPADGTHKDKLILNKEYKLTSGNFEVSEFGLENAGIDINMCNIRLYESEYAIGDAWKTDMYSVLTRNASKLIFIDNPQPANKQVFVSIHK